MKNKKSNLKETGIIATLILFTITIIVTAALAGVNSLTKDIIDQHNFERSQAAHSNIFSLAKSFNDYSAELISLDEKNIVSVFDAIDEDGHLLGIIIETLSKGYGGDIKVMTGISKNLEVVGVEIISNKETPGLGTKVTLPNFKEKFMNKLASISFTLNPNESDKNKVDKITGATISSQAVVKSVNLAIEFAKVVMPKIETGGNENG